MVISLLIYSIEWLLARPMMANLARLPLPTSTCWSQIQARGCTGSLQCNAMQDAILCNVVQDAIWRSITIHGALAVCNAMQCNVMKHGTPSKSMTTMQTHYLQCAQAQGGFNKSLISWQPSTLISWNLHLHYSSFLNFVLTVDTLFYNMDLIMWT